MKISEVIAELELSKKTHGDLDVVIWSNYVPCPEGLDISMISTLVDKDQKGLRVHIDGYYKSRIDQILADAIIDVEHS